MASTYPLVTEGEAHRAWDEFESNGTNVGTGERIVSLVGGGALTLYGLKRRGAVGTAARSRASVARSSAENESSKT